MDFKEIIHKLQLKQHTIATMESCTGGGVANAITNMEGASEVLKFSAVTYSNEYKIKMGVSKEIIDRYTVYSMETAIEMSHLISSFAGSDFGVGVTGKLNCQDPANPTKDNDTIYINIYEKEKNLDYNIELTAKNISREENKKEIITAIIKKLTEILK